MSAPAATGLSERIESADSIEEVQTLDIPQNPYEKKDSFSAWDVRRYRIHEKNAD